MDIPAHRHSAINDRAIPRLAENIKYSGFNKNDGSRAKRHAAPSSRYLRTDWQYLLGVYLNKNAAAGINPESIEPLRLAATLLDSVSRQPSIMPGIARLTLYGSQLYGERRGENLTPLQQRGLIGQALCRLIYQKESIVLRIATLFAGNRHVTQKDFIAVLRSWPYPGGYEWAERIWREMYEAPEIPALYLNSVYRAGEGQTSGINGLPATLDLDNLWVGSLTWTLMQFGARSMALLDPVKLRQVSCHGLIELGIGLVGLFRQGLLASGVEATLYLGLLLYYLRARPELGLGQVLESDTLDPAFALLKDEMEMRHLTAQRLYNGFLLYEGGYQQPSWRSRETAAAELIKRHCGRAEAPLASADPAAPGHSRFSPLSPVQQLIKWPSGQRCGESGEPVPDLDAYYRLVVDSFAAKIRELDIALLAAAFVASDVRDDNLQSEDVDFLQRAGIAWVIPRLVQIRRAKDMFYSNAQVHCHGKPDTIFFQARQGHARRLFALRITEQGYLLREILLKGKDLSALGPYMINWPAPRLLPQHRFHLLPVDPNTRLKAPNDTLSTLMERYAELHYQSYRQKIHDQGYNGTQSTFPRIAGVVASYVIPFYGCIDSLIARQHRAAFTECLVDGALVGLPLVFAGVKAGLVLFRETATGIGQTMGGPMFIAAETTVFRHIPSASVQIGGGILATRLQIGPFMQVIQKETLKSIDPGFAALRSLNIVGKGLYLALLGRAAIGLSRLSPHLAKVSGQIPKIITETLDFDLPVSYGADASTPQTVTVKGIPYSVMRIQNSSVVAVETGERTADGQLMFAQLDLHSRFGIYKKYYCLYTGNAQCRLNAWHRPDFELEANADVPGTKNSPYFWSLSVGSPLQLVVVHPLHTLDFADRQWVLFEINHRRWAFELESGSLIPADNIDEWQMPPDRTDEWALMIEPGNDNRTLGLHLTPLPQRRKRHAALHRVQDWSRLLANYTLADEGIAGFLAAIHGDAHLNVKIGEADYLLSPEKNAATFLLRHPTQATAPAFRVAYLIDGGDFVFASPDEPPNAHHIGEALRRRIAANPRATQAPYIDILLPPLVNGAFRYGNNMFLKMGDRFLHIVPSDAGYHTLPGEEALPGHEPWTLRYELFTGSFDIADAKGRLPAPYKERGVSRSRFDQLAARTYPKRLFPDLAALCATVKTAVNSSATPQSGLLARLRQVALLLRLDRPRRSELLHASSVALRTFRMDGSLADEWVVNFQPLALWATLENVAVASQARGMRGNVWVSRQWARVEGITWHFPPPVLIAQGPEPRWFIVNSEYSSNEELLQQEYEIQLLPDRLDALRLTGEGGFRRWLPGFSDNNQRTVVTKFCLSETPQPLFWIDEPGQVWAQTPDGVKTRLYRNNSRQAVADIVVSPDGGTLVLVYAHTLQEERVAFYHLPSMGTRAVRSEIAPYKDTMLEGSSVPGRAWWVTDMGDLFVPRENQWSLLAGLTSRWAAPAGYRPDFVSVDQRFLGFVRRNANTQVHEIMLVDTAGGTPMLLQRSRPVTVESFGMGTLVSVAFSALNALVAVGFSDGYIEIYRIHDEENSGAVASLGYLCLPLGNYVLPDFQYPKPKQMVMKFSNAFDRLAVFHDIGDFHSDAKGNGTYAVEEIYLADLA
ncbi:hypothetical protein [Acerihabitans arboris]|uniref:Uncharacterized protein n=1 Tax=Acerihabitans arboris TaxID=2691583 RepID=A0A845SKJ4_9GAMM|nr:hypothetical protein [Acerihabitans arboris]NDL63767.1 hypothetical protein [Acerihabitans arboris]